MIRLLVEHMSTSALVSTVLERTSSRFALYDRRGHVLLVCTAPAPRDGAWVTFVQSALTPPAWLVLG